MLKRSLAGHVYLVGFMGSGKSTLGPVLAYRLGCPFLDLDDWIQTRQGSTIAEIFRDEGEPTFRTCEKEALVEVAQMPSMVIALGGGAFLAKENRETVRKTGISIWLEVPFEVAARRCLGGTGRPLARERSQLRRLYDERLGEYRKADLRVTCEGTPVEVSERILRRLGFADLDGW